MAAVRSTCSVTTAGLRLAVLVIPELAAAGPLVRLAARRERRCLAVVDEDGAVPAALAGRGLGASSSVASTATFETRNETTGTL